MDALNGVHGATTQTLQDLVQSHPKDDAPSILIESALGIVTFPQLSDDRESMHAQRYIRSRLSEVRRNEPAQQGKEVIPTDASTHKEPG
ncbi:MAG TPA: hypothetical protein VK701_01855 [Solirubrobacteraceae bacterium]|nr:hypothetical protein [Solirubrobacteraceae bacterium]